MGVSELFTGNHGIRSRGGGGGTPASQYRGYAVLQHCDRFALPFLGRHLRHPGSGMGSAGGAVRDQRGIGNKDGSPGGSHDLDLQYSGCADILLALWKMEGTEGGGPCGLRPVSHYGRRPDVPCRKKFCNRQFYANCNGFGSRLFIKQDRALSEGMGDSGQPHYGQEEAGSLRGGRNVFSSGVSPILCADRRYDPLPADPPGQ